MGTKTEEAAIAIATNYEKSLGRYVIDLQSGRTIRGVDLLSISKKDKRDIKTIEVKGTTRPGSIPILSQNEITRERRLTAMFLYVVLYPSRKDYKLYTIPANELKSEYVEEGRHYAIKSTFRSKIMPRFLVKTKRKLKPFQ